MPKIFPSLGVLNPSQSSQQLVRTSTGNLYAFIISSGDVDTYKSTDNGLTWAEQDYRNAPAPAGTTIAVAIDGNDVIHVTYSPLNSTAPIKYFQFSTATDTFGRVETLNGVTGTRTNTLAIAVDSNNIPHIIKSGGTVAIGIDYWNRIGGFWNRGFGLSTASANFALDLQIDNNNIPQFSILTGANNNLVTVYQGNKNNASTFTSSTTLATVSSAVQQGTSLAIDASGNTWVAYVGITGRITLQKHLATNAWTTWQTPIDDLADGTNPSLAADMNDVYIFYERSMGGLAYDRYDTVNGRWLGEQIIQSATSPNTSNFRPHNPSVKWSQYFNNGDSGANNQGQQTIEYLFDDGSTIYYDKVVTAQISTGYVNFNPTAPAAGGTTTSTSSTSSSTSISTSTSSTSSSTSQSTSTSSTSSSTSISTSISTSSTSTSVSTSISTSSTSSSTSRSTSTSSTSSSTSVSTSTSSTSSSTSISSTSQSTSTSISSTSSSTSTSVSTSTSSTSQSTSISTSTSSTSTSLSTSTSSTSSSISTSSTSQSTSTSRSTSTSSTSQSTSISTSTSSTSSSISTSSTSSSISTSSTSSSISTSISTSTSSTSASTSQSFTTSTSSTSSSISTSSTSSSTSTSTSSTSTSISTSSTSTSRSTSTSSTSQSTSISTSTSSTSQSTSISTSSTSSSRSTSTSSTSSSTSQSTSTSSTSQSTSTTTAPATTTSTSSTSSSISTSSTSSSTSTTAIDVNMIPRAIIRPYRIWTNVRQPRPILR